MRSLLGALALVLMATHAEARLGYVTPIYGSESQLGDKFGWSMAMEGDTLVVGAPAQALNPARAYVFVHDGFRWTEQAILYLPNPSSFFPEYFGWSVAVDGDTIAVGSPYRRIDGKTVGAVYVFTRSGTIWNLSQTLVASDAQNRVPFGRSIAIDGDTLVVASSVGSQLIPAEVHVFERTGEVWSEVAIVSGPSSVSFFGEGLALEGNTLAVGTVWAGPKSAGVVYVYVGSGSTWTLEAAITNPEPRFDDNFGENVDLSGDTLVVGSRNDDDGLTGSVYVYVRNAGVWSQQAKLKADPPLHRGHLGTSLKLLGDSLIVGATHRGETTRIGRVYRFERSGSSWTQSEILKRPASLDNDAFGYSVAYDGTQVVVGSPLGVLLEAGSGSAFLFESCDGNPCTQLLEQQRCIKALNGDLLYVTSVQGSDIIRCIRDGARGNLPDAVAPIETCVSSDQRQRVASARERTIRHLAGHCGLAPDFGPTDADSINTASVDGTVALFHEIFGSDLDAAIVPNADPTDAGSRLVSACQRVAALVARKCYQTRLKVFNKCKRDRLRDATAPADTPDDLEACMLIDPKGRIAAACGTRLERRVGRRCFRTGADPARAFPAIAADAPGALLTRSGLAGELDRIVACLECRAVNEADRLSTDCDLLDDTSANGTCP